MNPFTSVWFWLLVVSIILFLIGFILLESTADGSVDGTSSTPWPWILIGIGFVVWIVALIWFAVAMGNWHKCREQAIACGDIVEEEKVIECEREKCGDNVECFRNTPCGKQKVDCNTLPTAQPTQPAAVPSAPPPSTNVSYINSGASTYVPPTTIQQTGIPMGASLSVTGEGSAPRQVVVVDNPVPLGQQPLPGLFGGQGLMSQAPPM